MVPPPHRRALPHQTTAQWIREREAHHPSSPPQPPLSSLSRRQTTTKLYVSPQSSIGADNNNGMNFPDCSRTFQSSSARAGFSCWRPILLGQANGRRCSGGLCRSFRGEEGGELGEKVVEKSRKSRNLKENKVLGYLKDAVLRRPSSSSMSEVEKKKKIASGEGRKKKKKKKKIEGKGGERIGGKEKERGQFGNKMKKK